MGKHAFLQGMLSALISPPLQNTKWPQGGAHSTAQAQTIQYNAHVFQMCQKLLSSTSLKIFPELDATLAYEYPISMGK